MAFLRQMRRTMRPNTGSGTLKHHAEDWGRENGLCGYVSRGALIAAAQALGYSIKRIGCGGDVEIGVRQCDLNRLLKHLRNLRQAREAARRG